MATTEASEQANRSGLDPKRLVVISLLGGAVVFAIFFAEIARMIWSRTGWADPQLIEGAGGWSITSVVGTLISLGCTIGVYVHPRTRQLLLEVATEMMRVTWPTWGETRVSTMAVVVASVVASGVLYGMDTLSYSVMVDWLPQVWRWVTQ